MNTDKISVRLLAEIVRTKGIKHLVCSPGSRSAPLIIAFQQIPEIEKTIVPDERVAGFVALGIAQQTQETVAVLCTSGTAVLNLAPAICEAFYQQIPLLILTADRPPESIGMGENQAIQQIDIYKNYIKSSLSLPVEIQTQAEFNQTIQQISTILDEAKNNFFGPVHINIPLREPLYNLTPKQLPFFTFKTTKVEKPNLSKNEKFIINTTLKKHPKVMLIGGLSHPEEINLEIFEKLNQLENVVILTETTSNIPPIGIPNFEIILNQLESQNVENVMPEIVITFGKQIVSKRIRQFFKNSKPLHHWHIQSNFEKWDIFGALSNSFFCNPNEIFKLLIENRFKEILFKKNWEQMGALALKKETSFLQNIPFSDLKVFEMLAQKIPANSSIQWGSSSSIRYSNLFTYKTGITHFSNRGTSGIDGCVSTAIGAAKATDKLTFCVVGDVSFLYDSNSLWQENLPPNLRIILINNGGGNIFRLIEGPKTVQNFESYFETKHHLNAENLAQMYSLPYFYCKDAADIDSVWEDFLKPKKTTLAILEIKTDGIISEKVYKDFFSK